MRVGAALCARGCVWAAVHAGYDRTCRRPGGSTSTPLSPLPPPLPPPSFQCRFPAVGTADLSRDALVAGKEGSGIHITRARQLPPSWHRMCGKVAQQHPSDPRRGTSAGAAASVAAVVPFASCVQANGWSGGMRREDWMAEEKGGDGLVVGLLDDASVSYVTYSTISTWRTEKALRAAYALLTCGACVRHISVNPHQNAACV